MTAQLDLFGEVEAKERERQRRAAERAAWRAQFEQVEMVDEDGDVVFGWRCPDPDCGEVVHGAFGLALNHGFDPDVPGHRPWTGECRQLESRRFRRRRQWKEGSNDDDQ